MYLIFNTEYKYREILGEQTIAEDREECSFIWDNYYDEDERINEYELTLLCGTKNNHSFIVSIRKNIFREHIRWSRSDICLLRQDLNM